METIHQQFRQKFDISDQDWSVFRSKLVRSEHPKHELLLKSGETENYLSFAQRGIVRLFVPGEDNDLTFGFAFENSFFSAYDSFLTQTPSSYCIECLTETILWRVSYKDLRFIYNQTKIGNLIGRQAAEEQFLKKARRELSLLHDSAEQRYLNLFSERPELIRNIPLKYIASYIGVTPQALSRIRKRIS